MSLQARKVLASTLLSISLLLASSLSWAVVDAHYVNPTGSATWPFTTPATAAHSLAQVIPATAGADSVLVVSGIFNVVDLQIERFVNFYGGYNADFTARYVEDAKTILQVSPTIQIPGPQANFTALHVQFDGFVFQGGTGYQRFVSDPFQGGAIRVFNSDLTVTNCEFRNNSVLDDDDGGSGGAIYIDSSSTGWATLNVIDCLFENNEATTGGAITMSGTTFNPVYGQILNTTFTNNQAEGSSAVHIWRSENILLEDNVFVGNSATGTGTLSIVNTSATVRGGSFTNNNVGSAGALYTGGGVVTVENLTVDNCAATQDGGAVLILGATSSVSVSNCIFRNCSTAAGGTVTAMGGTLNARHNLFYANNSSIPGMFLVDVTSGSIFGNTFADNTGLGPTFSFNNTGVDVTNNIIASNTGIGIICSGSPIPIFAYNLTFGTDLFSCGPPGVGTIEADPLFVNPAAGDYHLAVHSPAIDAGDPSILLVDPDGGRGDLGWLGSHDFSTDVPSTPQAAEYRVFGSGVVVTWQANPEPDIAEYVVYGSPDAEFAPSAALVRAIVAAPATSASLGPAGADVYFKVCAVDGDGYSSGFAIADERVSADSPARSTRLLGNRPNPFNPGTTIHFELASNGPVSLKVYDLAGRLVRTLVQKRLGAGSHAAAWNGMSDAGKEMSSGTYFYRLSDGVHTRTGKAILLK